MHASYDDSIRSGQPRGPALYVGYCGRTGRYRMMDLPAYLSSVQEGMSRWMRDAQTMYEDMTRAYSGRGMAGVRARGERDCGCGCGEGARDCHCECCVSDADVLVHARCGETRRIPITFENGTRRERQVTLNLDGFRTAGGRDLDWNAQLSQQAFTLAPCGEHTVVAAVQVRCEPFGRDGTDQPEPNTGAGRTASVDRCEVAYARLRADGCLIRPAVLAIAVLPDDCDAYRRACGCGCCD